MHSKTIILPGEQSIRKSMSNRRIVNVPKTRQRKLAAAFPWLMDIDLKQRREDVQVLSVSVFDHWLSDEESREKLENVSAVEQARRDALLADFCSRMNAATEVLSFAQRGRQSRHINFRRFLSEKASSNYCRPGGGKLFGHHHFHVVLPEFNCAFYESWDDTYHFFFTRPGIEEAAEVWAVQCGVHLLDR